MVVSVPAYAGEQSVGQKVEESVAGQRPHGKCDQELDEVLVEDLLHDRDDEDAEDAAQGNHGDGAERGQPYDGVADAAGGGAGRVAVGRTPRREGHPMHRVAVSFIVTAAVAMFVVVITVTVMVVVVVAVEHRSSVVSIAD